MSKKTLRGPNEQIIDAERPGAMFDDEGAYISALGNYVVSYGNILFGGSAVGDGRGVFGCTSIAD